MKNVKIDENYYLVSKQVNVNDVVEIDKSINHIVVVDCSGSMYGELPKIRTQLKNKLPSLMRDGDTISIVWFSGANDAGILKEEVEVKSLKTLADLNQAIDRWLVADCLTAFLKPLQLTKELIERVKKNRPDSLFSLIFLSDGYNNACNFNDVLKTLETLKTEISASAMIEYGFYADSQKLTQMASILGGEKISCDGFDDYDLVFENKLSSGITSGKKISVDVPSSLYDFAFSCDNGQILLYNIQDGKVLVNENLTNIFYFNSKAVGTELVIDENVTTALYAAINCLSDRFLNEYCEKIFYLLGDNYYYRMLLNAYGKQKLNAFKSEIKECVSDVTKRFPEGKSKIKPVPDDAFCLMNLIDYLSKSDIKFYPNHEDFNYNRIGRKKVTVGDKLNDNDQERLANAKTVKDMLEIAKELEKKRIDTEFVNTDENRGYFLSSLIWNESRANLSVLIKIDGTVKLPPNSFGISELASHKFRTFTFIKDGILNITKLPVDYNVNLYNFLVYNNVKFEMDAGLNNIVIDLSSLPIINRKSIKSLSAKSLGELEYKLLQLQAAAKVYGDYRKNLFPKTSKSFVDLMGQECADWLKQIGITDYNGYNPTSEFAESNDFYMSVNMDVKIKGLSSLPKVSEVIAKLALVNPILKPAELLMSKAIKEILPRLSDEDLEEFIINKTNEIVTKKRELLQQKAEIVFALILSKKNFIEFKSFDENTLTLTIDGQIFDFTFNLSEKEVKI